MAKKKTSARRATNKKARTKGQVFGALAEHSELSRKQVASLFDGLAGMI